MVYSSIVHSMAWKRTFVAYLKHSVAEEVSGRDGRIMPKIFPIMLFGIAMIFPLLCQILCQNNYYANTNSLLAVVILQHDTIPVLPLPKSLFNRENTLFGSSRRR